ncbi:hypothetical protein OIU74_006449 [Salix koriyanagi]|uniref:Uncharacterized protein n=1 Tax=Salix koriyanagi TaxID=2511006 RepID=A0A9Q0UEE4_9ROSI|nr:hypothetical protein OIU74_006449 [Salix koriyanagi]
MLDAVVLGGTMGQITCLPLQTPCRNRNPVRVLGCVSPDGGCEHNCRKEILQCTIGIGCLSLRYPPADSAMKMKLLVVGT